MSAQCRTLNQRLASPCAHPRIQELEAESLRSEAMQFIAGAGLGNLRNLQIFMASLKFGSCSERRIEGGHAIVNIKTSGRRNRSESHD
eukprot:7445276-Pyramimonas_sp.AAC.1